MSNICNHADWPFIQNGAVTLFFRQEVLENAIEIMQREGYAERKIDCVNETTMLRDFSEALRWQEQFGYEPKTLNLNALSDAMGGATTETHPRVLV